MAVSYNDNIVKMNGMISDSEITPLRDFFHTVAPKKVVFDLEECIDIHTAVLQIINAYASVYEASFIFNSDASIIKKALEGFVICD
jgi:hypothetical protein